MCNSIQQELELSTHCRGHEIVVLSSVLYTHGLPTLPPSEEKNLQWFQLLKSFAIFINYFLNKVMYNYNLNGPRGTERTSQNV